MQAHELTEEQQSIVHDRGKTFLSGPAGSGKTTAATTRLLQMLDDDVPSGSILVMAPQRTLLDPYYKALETYPGYYGQPVNGITLGGLARRMVELFWPLVSADAGFREPDQPPTFLTLETAQFFMAQIIRPMEDQGFFQSLTMDRNRLYSQVIDNLNKAAVNGYLISEIEPRLLLSASDSPEQRSIYADAQEAATRFRQYCLNHNLLDYSLQVELFANYLWASGHPCREVLEYRYNHLIYDNLEEDTPVAHDIVLDWLPHLDSALLLFDEDGGYRRFLGADPASARRLESECDQSVRFELQFNTPPPLTAFNLQIDRYLSQPVDELPSIDPDELSDVLVYDYHRFFPEMLVWVADTIADLVHVQGASPDQIVVLAPFLSDSLRYSLQDFLQQRGVETRSHRPSRSLRDEPVSRALITLLHLANPDWGFVPTKFEVAGMLLQAIDGLDLVRADLLAGQAYTITDGRPALTPFDALPPESRERVTFVVGERYEYLRQWLEDLRQDPERHLDFTLSRLFGEVLSQPGFGFHNQLTAGETTANLIESIQKFRWITSAHVMEGDEPLGKTYLEMVQYGVIAAQYIRSWHIEETDAVLLAPAYTFLMRNQPVDYQFWLDVGSTGWHERIYQPLTHPYVLNRYWPTDQPWLDGDEVAASQSSMARLVTGLVRRCRVRIYLGLSELNETGYEGQGLLLKAVQRSIQQIMISTDLAPHTSTGSVGGTSTDPSTGSVFDLEADSG